MTKYALLDFDGFICKAWFASKSKHRTEYTPPETILRNLVREAINKATRYFNSEVTTYLFVSGHTYKKDLYPTYKATREKDEDMQLFRDAMISEYDAIKSEQLEADDLISICISAMDESEDYITFSDDKDLRDISEQVCKINVNSEVEELGLDGFYINLLCRLLAGDKEDNVTGIPKVGMSTALKLLDTFPSIRNTFEIYKSKNISIDEALKQVTLIAPVIREWNEYPADVFYTGRNILDEGELDENIITEIIIGQVTFLSKLAMEVYLDENKKN